MSATEHLAKAAELSKIAEELEAALATKTQKFKDSQAKAEAKFREETAADEAKVKEARREAAAAIRKASAAMGDSGASSRSTARPGSRSSADPDAVVAFVKANDGTNAAAVAEAVGVSPATARKAVDALIADGKLTKTGERRGTKLHAA